jgi:hypothetical protein
MEIIFHPNMSLALKAYTFSSLSAHGMRTKFFRGAKLALFLYHNICVILAVGFLPQHFGVEIQVRVPSN